MERIKLQNVVLPRVNSELFFHEKEDELLLDGYFNVFEVADRKKYTDLKEVIFKIKCVGIKTLYLMHDKKEIDEYELSGNSLVGIFVAISIALSKKTC